MTQKQKYSFWIAATLLLIAALYLFRAFLLPFVAGMALAYLLDPLVDRLERAGIGRAIGSLLVLLLFAIVFIVAMAALLPLIVTQIQSFLIQMPGLVNMFVTWISGTIDQTWIARMTGSDGINLDDNLKSLTGHLASWVGNVFGALWSSGQAFVSLISVLFVTPIVTYYLLVDWDRMIKQIDDILPHAHRATIRRLAREVDDVLSGFIRGQGSVCLILGIAYAVCLVIIGLSNGLLIGLFAGLIGFIPYMGSAVGLLLSVGVALFQFWPEWALPLMVAGIFVAGQFVEGNILQPKLVGSRVRLHPVWLIFALFAFGNLAGFAGMLVAVPVAASIGVLVRFSVETYKESALYGPKPPTLSDSANQTKNGKQ